MVYLNIFIYESNLLLLLLIITYFTIVRASYELTDLPNCNSPPTNGSEKCDASLPDEKTYCKKGNEIYISTKNSCTKFPLTAGNYYTFECDNDTCDLDDDTIGEIVYYYDGTNLELLTQDYTSDFSDSGANLIKIENNDTISVNGDTSSVAKAEDLTPKYAIYKCNKGICSKSEGYTFVTNGGTTKVYKFARDGNNWKWSEYNPSANNCSESNRGDFKIENNDLKLCITGDAFTSIEESKYFILSKKQIISVAYGEYYTANVLTVENAVAGNYLVNSLDEIIDFADLKYYKEPTDLIVCSGSSCTKTPEDEVSYGYYAKGLNPNELYFCNGMTCDTKDEEYYDDKLNYYVDTDGNLHLCIDEICPMEENPDGYYIDTGTVGNIISCDKNATGGKPKCKSINGISGKGYAYIDASENGNNLNKKFITCPGDGTACTVTLDKSANLYANDNLYLLDPANPKQYIECVGKGSAETPAAADCTIKKASDLQTNIAFFTDGTDATYTITCVKNGGCFSSKGLQQCKSISSDSKCTKSDGTAIAAKGHCIHTDGKIYYTTDGSKCAAITDPDIYFFKTTSDYAKADSNEATVFIYKCDDNGCTQYVNTSYLEPKFPATYLYVCVDGTCTKKTSDITENTYYFTSIPTLSTTRPYLVYKSLLFCSGTGVGSCSDVTNSKNVGYYLSDSEYIFVKRESDGTYMFGKLDAKPTDKCSASNVGKLGLTSSGGVAICLEKTLGKAEDFGNTGEKLLDYGEGNVFGMRSGQKILADIQEKSITLKVDLPQCDVTTDESNNVCTLKPDGSKLKQNKYCISGGSKKTIYKGIADDKCEIVKVSQKDEGFKIFNVSNVLDATLITDISATLTNPYLSIYHCAYGECIRTSGYIQNNGKVYKSSEDNTIDITNQVTNVQCEDHNDQGNIKFTVSGSVKTLEVCVFDRIDITGKKGDDHATTETKSKWVNVVDGKNYVLRPYTFDNPNPTNVAFANASYSNIALLRTESNVVALARHSPQLPLCDDTCKVCEDTNCTSKTTSIQTNEFCLLYDGTTIFKKDSSNCKKMFGKDATGAAANGIKIFQRTSTFNKFIDVTSTLDSVSPNQEELTPFFVIYDCSDTKCLQSSGFIKYGSNNEFVNCYMGNNINAEDDSLVSVTSHIGCIRLNEDKSHDDLCSVSTSGTAEQAQNAIKLAATGSYKFDGETFRMCINVVDEDEYEYENEYLQYDNTKLISIPFGGEGEVFFKNGKTPFPNTLENGNVLIRFSKNYGVLARNIKTGYYYNFATVYDGQGKGKEPGYDALISCFDADSDYYYGYEDEGTGESALSQCEIEEDFLIEYDYADTDTTHFLDMFSKRVITCKYSGCHLQRKTIKGFFLNDNDFEEVLKPVIQCNGTLCEEIEDKQDGKLKVKLTGIAYIDSLSDGYGYGENTVYICYDGTCNTDGTDRIEIKKESDGLATYKSFKGVQANKFPGVAAGGKITLKISDGAAVLMENDSLTACSETISASSPCFNGAREGQFCWHASTKKIYENSNGGCTVKTVDEDGQLLFFDTKGKVVSELTKTRTDVLAYHCTSTECGLFKGYAIVGGNSIHCNGWKDEGCDVEEAKEIAACAKKDTGKFTGNGGSNKLCFTDGTTSATASRDVSLPTDDNVKMIAFSATEANKYYGAALEDIVFLSISKDLMKVIATPKPTTDSYYFNQFAGPDEKNVMIKCNSSGCSQVNFHSGTGLNNNAIIDSGDPMKKSIVYQSNSRYEYHDRTSDLKSSKLNFVNQLDQSKVIICTDADGCSLETGSVIAGHAYIDNKSSGNINKNIITCVGQSCSVNDNSSSVQGENTLYYIDGKETNKVIKVSTNGCESKEGSTANAHAYVNADGKSIITCNSTGCTVTTFTTADLSSEKKFIYGDDIEYLITCSASAQAVSCAKDTSKGTGSHVDGSDSNRTINCVSGKGCISSAAISSGCESGITNGDSLCKDNNGNSIDSGYYCYSNNNIIYESTEDGKCKGKTEDVLIEKIGNKYKAAEWGISSTGIIYVYDSNSSSFEQVISSYHLYTKDEEKYLYKCDESGNCMIVNKISIGYYLSGKPEVGTVLTYGQLIQCTDTIATSCSRINEITSGYYVDAGNLNNVIICGNQCKTQESNKKQGVAYLDSGDVNTKSYITCNEEKCESITTNLTGDEKLYFIDGSSDTKLIECSRSGCVSQNAVVGKALDGTDKNYTITCVSGNNGGATCVSEKECRVNTGANCEDSKYYNVQAANPTDYILEKGSTAGTLYYCKEDTEKESGFSCSKMDSPGYYINSKDEIYQCVKVSGSEQLECIVHSLTANTCAKAEDIGKLFIDGNGKLNLCVNYTDKAYPVLIDSNTSGNYLIQKSDVTVFGIPNEANAIVKVDGNSVAINKNYKYTKDYYVYVNKETFAVLNNNQCPSHQNMLITDVVEEYKKCDNNYLKKSTETC